MLASVACFAASVLTIRALGTQADGRVWWTCSVRFVVGLAVVMVLFRAQWDPMALWRNRKLMERGVIGGLSVCGFYLTLPLLGAGRATFINNTYVVFGPLMAAVWLREPLRRPLVFGAVVSVVGLALLTNAIGRGAAVGLEDAFAVGVALASAWVVITIRQLHATGVHTATIFSAQCGYGLVLCLPLALGYGAMPSTHEWMLMVVAALAATGGQLFMTYGFARLSVAAGSLIQMLVPVIVAAGGMVWFGEALRPGEWLGAGLVLAGTALPFLGARVRRGDSGVA
jgi:drug/metabolite transporter (DMT)-like permease